MDTVKVENCYVGSNVNRKEDDKLISGKGQFGADLSIPIDSLHVAVLRSDHASAIIKKINLEKAINLEGVHSILTGRDFSKISNPLLSVIRTDFQSWCCAIDEVKYVGEPIALILAENRYIAEDAIELIEVEYSINKPIIDIKEAIKTKSKFVHTATKSNVVSDRYFEYGNPKKYFNNLSKQVEIEITYPRNSCTPLEGFVVHSYYDHDDKTYTVQSNFQGPYSLHSVLSRALKTDEGKLRLISINDSGGSFGIKQAIMPMIILTSLASKITNKNVVWIEDRIEHLTAASSATGRLTKIKASVSNDGLINAIDYDQVDDVGAYLRAPEPASLYRMHGNLSGPYIVKNISCRNRVVITNKTPSGLNRGFGGPQHYFALERLIKKIADELKLDHLDVITKNILNNDQFPYKSPAGAILDSGDYKKLIEKVKKSDTYKKILNQKKQSLKKGMLYGIGYSAIIEPSISNMGYITTALPYKEREKSGHKGGALASSSVSIGPTGSVYVSCDSIPQGQGHKTVLSQVVADIFSLKPNDIIVNTTLDTQKDPWSIAAGNYSSRFAGAVAGTTSIAAKKLKKRLIKIASSKLNCKSENITFIDGIISDKNNSQNNISFKRLAGISHWSPGEIPEEMEQGLREVAFWSDEEIKPPNEKDEINGSLVYGFVFDVCGIEIDPSTSSMKIDKYITGHDAGKILNPLLADGQIYGAYAHAVGASTIEEFRYEKDGSFLSGSFQDYLLPSSKEINQPEIIHIETPSPLTPLGSKGLGEGNCMSTPVAIANAFSDATGINNVILPLTKSKIHYYLNLKEKEIKPKFVNKNLSLKTDYPISGSDNILINMNKSILWKKLLDVKSLKDIIPGCKDIKLIKKNTYLGIINIKIGPIKGEYKFVVQLTNIKNEKSLTLKGNAIGKLGRGNGEGSLNLKEVDGKINLSYSYAANVNGKISIVGNRLLNSASKIIINQFFNSFLKIKRPKTTTMLNYIKIKLGIINETSSI